MNRNQLPIRRLRIPIKEFRETIRELDAQTSDIVAALRDPDAHTHIIAENRDDLYRRLWAWDATLAAWSNLPVDRQSYDATQRLEGLYRFPVRKNRRFLRGKEHHLN